MEKLNEVQEALVHLLKVVRKLRSPEGCRWDRKQKKVDVARYLLEETYELVEAIEEKTPREQKEELGDLIFQVVVLAEMAREKGEFDLTEVIQEVAEKMVRRHPHVFGGLKVESVAQILENWDRIKEEEGKRPTRVTEVMAKHTRLPALMAAQKVSKEAAKVGFDWSCKEEVFGKVEEEMKELKVAIQKASYEKVKEEMGDLLFSLVNLCRFLQLDAEETLRLSVKKFIERFSYVEKNLAHRGKKPGEVAIGEMDALWEEGKAKNG